MEFIGVNTWSFGIYKIIYDTNLKRMVVVCLTIEKMLMKFLFLFVCSSLICTLLLNTINFSKYVKMKGLPTITCFMSSI